MRSLLATLLVVASVARLAAAQLKFTVEATHKGKPIPKSEIKIVPIAIDQARSTTRISPAKNPMKKEKRANPTATSGNWCGSVNHATSADPIKVVHAYYQHPACTKRTGVTQYPQAAAAWAGIDGDSWTSALLQSGTACQIHNSTGVVTNEAWWQWIPSGAWTITSLPVAPYDWFEVIINTTSSTSGKITLTNLSQSYTYTMTVSGGQALGRVDAEWVVERPYYGSSLSGFAAFTDVWFQGAYATKVSGSNLGILGATQLQIPGSCESLEYDDATQVSWSI